MATAVDPICKMEVDTDSPPRGPERPRGHDVLLLCARLQSGLRQGAREVPGGCVRGSVRGKGVLFIAALPAGGLRVPVPPMSSWG